MDNEICNVGTQYIICECGDNFPNEKFLNIHLANGHAEVETFQCDVCPEVFTSANSLALHISTHQSDTPDTSKKLKLKTYSRKSPLKEIKFSDSADFGEGEVRLEQPLQVKKEKKTPVIKLKNLKRIDSISLIENLKAFGGFIKIEPLANTQEPESQTEPELPEPQPEPEPELSEPEPEAEPESIFMEVEEEEGQVIVKNEKQEAAEIEEEREEIYYQCDVCNSIFYTEWDFNVHYQSAHALKLEPGTGTPEQSLEQSLERHLVTDHADDEGVQAETTTAYYYECELGAEETDKSGARSVIADGATDDALTDVRVGDVKTLCPARSTEEIPELNEKVPVKVVKKGGRPKKVKKGRPFKDDVYLDMPPELSASQKEALAKKRRIEIVKERNRRHSQNYRKRHPERLAATLEKYKKKIQERVINSEAVVKHAIEKKLEKTNKEENEFRGIMEDAVDEIEINNECTNSDLNTHVYPVNPEENDIQKIDDHDLLKVVKVAPIKEGRKRGRPKKAKRGRPPTVDVYQDMPPGLSHSQIENLAKKRRKEINRERAREAWKRRRLQKNQEKIKIKEEINIKELETREDALNVMEIEIGKLNADIPVQICPANCEKDNIMQELDDQGLVKVAPKKKKRGRPPKEDSDMPSGLSSSEKATLAKQRRIEIRSEQLRKASEKFRKNNPEAVKRASKKYDRENPEVQRRARKKYAHKTPEAHRRAVKKYAQKNPEVNRRAVKKYNLKKKLEKQRMKDENMAAVGKKNKIKGVKIKEEVLNEIKIEVDEVEIEVEEILGY